MTLCLEPGGGTGRARGADAGALPVVHFPEPFTVYWTVLGQIQGGAHAHLVRLVVTTVVFAVRPASPHVTCRRATARAPRGLRHDSEKHEN